MESNDTSVRILDLLFELIPRSIQLLLAIKRRLKKLVLTLRFNRVEMSSFTAYAGQILSCLSFHSKNIRCST